MEGHKNGQSSKSAAAALAGTEVEVKKEYPHRSHSTLIAPLVEGAIPTYLEALNVSITEKYNPSPLIVQSLLFLTLNPPVGIPARCPSPIAILQKTLALHSPADLMARHTLPICPTEGSAGRDRPAWLDWEAEGNVPKQIMAFMQRAKSEGIWALLWQGPTGAGSASEEDEDEDEEEGDRTAGKVVSEGGWKILGWLIDLWDKDSQSHPQGHSPAFLAQLPKHRDMQYDNAASPLAVFRSALRPHTGASKTGARRRWSIARRLMRLLVKTASTPTSSSAGSTPPFHPPSLTLALLPLLLCSPTRDFADVESLFQDVPPAHFAHFLVHAIEDLAGVRASKAASRRQKSANAVADFEPEAYFPAPTVRYTLECILLPLSVSSSSTSGPVAEAQGQQKQKPEQTQKRKQKQKQTQKQRQRQKREHKHVHAQKQEEEEDEVDDEQLRLELLRVVLVNAMNSHRPDDPLWRTAALDQAWRDKLYCVSFAWICECAEHRPSSIILGILTDGRNFQW